MSSNRGRGGRIPVIGPAPPERRGGSITLPGGVGPRPTPSHFPDGREKTCFNL